MTAKKPKQPHVEFEHKEMRKVLEQIAGRKRRTMEQRLASSLLTFLDAMRVERELQQQ